MKYKVGPFSEIEVIGDLIHFRHLNGDGEVCSDEAYNVSADWIQEYFKCRHCGGIMPEERAVWALNRYQKDVCSRDCFYAEEKKKYACCDQAERVHCVCMVAYSCKVHGERHVGTHD